MGKKNLDKLFQEKLRDFSDAPDEKVWQSINASLDKKKKSRKVIPIWWKLSGVAATLLIAVLITNLFDTNTPSIESTVEVENQKDKTNSTNKEAEKEKYSEKSDTEIVDVTTEGALDEGIIKEEEVNTEKISNFNTTANKESVQIVNENTSNTRKNPIVNPTKEVSPVLKNSQEPVVMIQKSTTSQKLNEKKAHRETVAQVPDTRNDFSIKKESGIAHDDEKEKSNEKTDSVTKKSIFDEIAEQEQEKEVVAENKSGKWSAGPSIAPVYFDAIGEGSPVHSIFIPNSKSGDLNLSYGLSVAYEINTKLKIRSGVHRVDYGYSTDEVEFSSSLESSAIGQIANVNYSATAKNIVVASNASEAVNRSEAMQDIVPVAQDFSGQGLSQNGAMTQQFGYLEVPLELEYALIDKKFGVNLIGGVSSLFLVDNSISLSSGELVTEMGEANNVNDVNFSTNVGIGFNYRFTSNVRLNVEPVFKYQLNTFSQTDGNFQPFTVGVYSGISFKF